MTPEQHKQFLISIKQTQQRSKKVLESVQQTLSGVKTTISDIKDTNQKFDRFKQQYNRVIEKLAIKISNSFSNPLKRAEGDQRPGPKIVSMAQAIENMMAYKEILFITGAGVSVDSGIPTFRGRNGLYDKKFQLDGLQLEPEAFINKEFFDRRPQPIWQWIQSLNKMILTSKPNKIHHLIHKILSTLTQKGRNPTLITQNIDNLHIKPQPPHLYPYHQIHGQANLIRCKNLHFQPYSLQVSTQACPVCQQKMRPHVMFFDEAYGVPFGQGIKDRTWDFVVVIGSSLSTGLCIKMATSAKEIIQINPEPVIQVGNVYPFNEKTDQVLEDMLKCIEKIQEIF